MTHAMLEERRRRRPDGTYIGRSIDVRFWPRVDMTLGPRGCWLYMGRRDRKNYGRFWYSYNIPMALAHRLSAREIRAIRAAYAKGGVTHEVLAKRYKVCRPMITMIIRGTRWKHVQEIQS